MSFDWAGYGKTAIFYREEKQVYHVVMVSDACVIPNPITATTAFALNELGWQEGHIYRSGMEGNTHQPGDLNAPWTMVR